VKNQKQRVMDLSLKIVDLVAIIIQFVGALLMYNNSPINKQSQMGETNLERINNANKGLKTGFKILALGLLISFISLFLKDFIVPIYI
jgi:hypothetical protein